MGSLTCLIFLSTLCRQRPKNCHLYFDKIGMSSYMRIIRKCYPHTQGLSTPWITVQVERRKPRVAPRPAQNYIRRPLDLSFLLVTEQRAETTSKKWRHSILKLHFSALSNSSLLWPFCLSFWMNSIYWPLICILATKDSSKKCINPHQLSLFLTNEQR